MENEKAYASESGKFAFLGYLELDSGATYRRAILITDNWGKPLEWCRAHCIEWTSATNGCAPIAVEQIGMAPGKTPQQIQRLRQEAVELNRLDEIFTPA